MRSNQLNFASIQGRFVAAPELKTTTSGKSVTSFTIACQHDKENASFIDCVAWERTAETICQYFGKGDVIIVEGGIKTRNWEDKHGNKRKETEIQVDAFHFCGTAEKKPDTEPKAEPKAESGEGDLPF